MKIITLQFNDFAENTYIVYDPDTLDCAIIDPGMSTRREEKHIERVIEAGGLNPVHVINTHMHIDHVLGNDYFSSRYALNPEYNSADAFLAERVSEQAKMFGMKFNPVNVPVGTYLSAGDIIKIGRGELKVIEVPGHSPGSIALYDAQDGFILTGDALFAGSIGRTDLPGGSFDKLIASIRAELLTLPDSTQVYPGHGPMTTIVAEKNNNPFLS